MPFPTQDPRPYTKEGAQSIKTDQRGVYGLIQVEEDGWAWIYIGRAEDIRERLLEHLNEDDPCLISYPPTHFVAAITKDDVKREKELILEYDPECNKRVG